MHQKKKDYKQIILGIIAIWVAMRGAHPDPFTDLIAHLPRLMGYELGP